jgi:hypothetical protein
MGRHRRERRSFRGRLRFFRARKEGFGGQTSFSGGCKSLSGAPASHLGEEEIGFKRTRKAFACFKILLVVIASPLGRGNPVVIVMKRCALPMFRLDCRVACAPRNDSVWGGRRMLRVVCKGRGSTGIRLKGEEGKRSSSKSLCNWVY